MSHGARKAVSDWPVAQFGHLKLPKNQTNEWKQSKKKWKFRLGQRRKGRSFPSRNERGVERECGRSMTELSLPPPYTVTRTEPEGNQLVGTEKEHHKPPPSPRTATEFIINQKVSKNKLHFHNSNRPPIRRHVGHVITCLLRLFGGGHFHFLKKIAKCERTRRITWPKCRGRQFLSIKRATVTWPPFTV